MKRKKIVVLFGGNSTEYDVSLKSAYSVITNLDTEKYEVIPMGITKDGKWLRYLGDYKKIIEDTWLNETDCIPSIISPNHVTPSIIEFHNDRGKIVEIDAVFPVLHGKNGEDGTLQGLLEISGIPFVGCGSLCSAICMDKDIAHKIVESEGIKVPKSIVLNKINCEDKLKNSVSNLSYPLFIKPVKSGSSFGISMINSPEELSIAVQNAFNYDDRVIIEEKINGFEVGCAILGNDELIIGELDEIELSNGFFNFTEKYSLETSKIHMPARIDKTISEKIKETASKIYKVLQCRGFARVDVFLTKDNEIIFNEVNTIPGFTSHSRYPNMLKGIGISFTEVLDKLIELVVIK